MDQRMLLAIGLSMLVIVAFYLIFPPQSPQPPQEQPPAGEQRQEQAGQQPARTATGEAAPPAAPGGEPAEPLQQAQPQAGRREQAKLVRVETPRYLARVDTRGGRLVSLQLKHYRRDKEHIGWSDFIPALRGILPADEYRSGLVEMVKRDLPGVDSLGVGFVDQPELATELANTVFTPDAERLQVGPGADGRSLELVGRTDEGITVRKTLTFHPDSYVVDYDVAVINYGEQARTLRVQHLFGEGGVPTAQARGFYTHYGPMYRVEESVETEDADDLENLLPVREPAWVGITSPYFFTAARNETAVSYAFYQSVRNPSPAAEREWVAYYGMELPVVTLEPDKQVSSRFTLYMGPKDTPEMEKFGHHLEDALDLPLETIALPLLALLRWFFGLTGNYGVAIILLTIVVRAALFPLTYKGMVSMKRMQKLQPRMTALRDKYKNDRERMNREMMALYKRAKVNPLGGCLPILLQLPIFFALYGALAGAIELRHAPFMLWINDLSAKDGLYITPILMGGSMMLQQKLSPTTPDPMQARLLMWMPAVFTVFMLAFPSGLVLYWFTSNLLSILQQVVINRVNVPEPAEQPA